MQSKKSKVSTDKDEKILDLRMQLIRMRTSRFVLFTAIKNSLSNLLDEDLSDKNTRRIIIKFVHEVVLAKFSLKDIDPDFANLFYKNLDPFVCQLLADKEKKDEK